MSSAKIAINDVRHVAKLARLALDEPHLEKLTGQLESILGYIAKINQVDMTDVEPMAHALPLHNVLREDVVEPGLSLQDVLKNAPDTDPPFFKIPPADPLPHSQYPPGLPLQRQATVTPRQRRFPQRVIKAPIRLIPLGCRMYHDVQLR
jgi:aspartyl-tRNA(Asn)/glutamyl-tRNA(Gln) amidotransferase subunit C